MEEGRSFLSLVRHWAIMVMCLGLWSCGEQKSPYASKNNVEASDDIKDSFEILENEVDKKKLSLGVKEDLYHVSIHKEALEKEFLLRVNMVEQFPIPSFSGLKTRVVSFKQKGESLFLMESTKGHTISHDIPQNLILTEFPIIEEEGDSIIFDFNAGMQTIFIGSDWRGSDDAGRGYQEEFEAMDVDFSFIDKASFNKEKEELYIRQVVQIDEDQARKSMEVRYFLSPYRPDPTFKPTVSKDFEKVGFFEVAPFNKLDGTTVVHASKFHSEKPIIFALSANTPKVYRETVKEGILYWNKALGKDLIKVVMAPKEVSAPHPDYNVIQWVNWDLAGFAYADAQMDPRTGQVLHAQVFLTSTFAFEGIEQARHVLGTLKRKETKRFSIKGFQKDKMCQFHLNQKLKRDLERLLEGDPMDQQLLRVSRDYVAELVAHEVGHTLGLRHNFAGSLGQNYSLKERKSLFKAYYKKGEVPDHIRTSSSVMDYQMFFEGAVTGHIVRKSKKALEYDRLAMENLYFKKDIPEEGAPLFCTDSHSDGLRFHDCDVFDAGTNFVEFVVWDFKDTLDLTPGSIIKSFVRAKVGDLGRPAIPLKKVILSPKRRSKMAFGLYYNMIRAFTQEGRFLRIHRRYPVVGELEKEIVREEELDFLENQWEGLEDSEDIFPEFGHRFVETELLRFDRELDKRREGVGALGRPYIFSEEELRFIKAKAKRFYVLFERELQKEKLRILSGELSPLEKYLAKAGYRSKKGIFEFHPVADRLGPLMKKAILGILLPEKEDVISTTLVMNVKEGDKKVKKSLTVDLPQFVYPKELRFQAANVMKNIHSRDLVFGDSIKKELKMGFEKKMKVILKGQSLGQIDLAKISKKVHRWVVENKKILSSLSK